MHAARATLLAMLLPLAAAPAADPAVHRAADPAADPAGPGAGEDPKLTFRGSQHALDELPEEIPEAARSAVLAWAAWAGEAEYGMDLESKGRILLISRLEGSRLKRTRELVESTADLFDRKLPPPERLEPLAVQDAPPEEVAASPEGDDPLPEDPEGGPAPWEELGAAPPEKKESAPTWSTTWGAADAPPDTETIVFFILRDADDFSGVLEQLARTHSYLAPWAREAVRFPGFAVPAPLVGGYVEIADGMEEWDPANELVNRLAQLLMLRRFGQQPYWIVQGWAWYAEFAIRKAVYCFPYRDEFISIGEHTDWDRELKNRFRKRRDDPVRAEEFVYYKRGVYVDDYAKLSWGAVDFLLEKNAAATPGLFEELRVRHNAGARVDRGDGTWQLDTAYVLPADTQAQVLAGHLGEDVFERMTSYFREGLR